MTTDFKYDVFISYSAKDKAVVRPLAERLRMDGLKVWFDKWEIKPKASKATRIKKIEEGLEHSRVLVLCMSANAFGSDWAQLESQTLRFCDPLNRERRFIPLRLDDAPIKGSLAQFFYINWRPSDREQEYAKPLEVRRTTRDRRRRKWLGLCVGFLIPSINLTAYTVARSSRCGALRVICNGRSKMTHTYTSGGTNVPRV
jgi:hypothetical protein